MTTPDVSVATSSPVINFAETAAKRRPARRVGKRPDHPDAGLIEHCIEYATQIKNVDLAYLIDPTDSDFAAIADDLAHSRADRAMRGILQHEVATMDGLRVKANLITACMENWTPELRPLQRDFLKSLAQDVVRFHLTSQSQRQNDISILETT